MSARPRPSGTPFLIAHRELGRVGRRASSALFRSAFTAVFFALFIFTFITEFHWNNDVIDPADYGEFGGWIFRGGYVLWVLTCMVVPAVFAIQAIHAERDARTLDILALTGLSPLRVLTGLILSRSYLGFLIIAAPAPLIAFLPSFGGVSLEEAAAALVIIIATFVVTTAIAMPIAVTARSLPVAIIAVILWWFILGLLVPLRLGYSSWLLTGSQPLTMLAPPATVFSMTTVHSASNYLPQGLLLWGCTVLIAPAIAAWTFNRGIRSGWNRREKSWPGLPFGWLIHLPLQVGGWYYFESHLLTLDWDAYYQGATPANTTIWPFVLLGALMVSASILYLRTMTWLLPRLDLSRTRNRIPVFGDPVFWREVFTNAQGGLSRVSVGALAAVLFASALIGLSGETELTLPLVLFAGFAAFTLCVLTALSSVLQERRLRTLPLLTTTLYGPFRIIVMKTIAIALRTLPILGLAWGLGIALWEWEYAGRHEDYGSPTNPLMLSDEFEIWMVYITAASIWAASIGGAFFCATAVKNRALATGATFGLCFALIFVLPTCVVGCLRDLEPEAFTFFLAAIAVFVAFLIGVASVWSMGRFGPVRE